MCGDLTYIQVHFGDLTYMHKHVGDLTYMHVHFGDLTYCVYILKCEMLLYIKVLGS